MRLVHTTGPLHGRHPRPPRATGADASGYVSLASILVGFIAIMLVVASFGVLSIPPAAIGLLLGSRARRELRDDSPPAARHLAAVAWWVSVVAMVLSVVAIVVLLLDVGGIVDRLVERAR